MPNEPSEPYGQDRHVEVLLAGMEGETPDLPVDFERLEAEAKEAINGEAYDYVAGGAGEERTASEYRRAFDRWQIVPRMIRDVELAHLPFLDGEGVANYLSDPAFLEPLDQAPEEDPMAAIMCFVDVLGDPTLTWDDLAFIRERTDLPILLKGVLHPDDVKRAVDEGVDGVIVSNHGGRQVDGAIPALDGLPGVVDAVGDDLAVLFDSGVRTGSDAIRAIALGAEAVLYGRPYAYGLAIDGEDGVAEAVSNFRADLDMTLGLSGQTSIADLDRSVLVEAVR